MRRSLARLAALALVAAVWLRFPTAGRGQAPAAPPADGDPAALVRALGDPAERVRFRAMAELLRIGRPATRELAQALLDTRPIADNQDVSRSDLAFAVLTHAPDMDVDALLEAYRAPPPDPIENPKNSENKAVTPRQRIRELLAGSAAKPTERVYQAFQGADPELQISLAEMLGHAGPQASAAVPWLARAVAKDGNAKVRTSAASALARIPDGGPQALRSLFKHADPRIRVVALAAYPAGAKDSAELAARSLRDPALEVRTGALQRIWSPETPAKDDLDDYDWRHPCQSARDGRPASVLLADFPNSALPDVIALTRHAKERTRGLAIQALGSLACARRDLAPAAVEALLKMWSDPAGDVGTEALYRLLKLAELKEIPQSPELLDKLLRGLADPTDEMVRPNLILGILEHLDLPDSRRTEIVGALVTSCLSAEWNCERVRSLLSTRPSWQATWIAALASQPRNCSADALTGLWGVRALPIDLLERFLSHWQSRLRVRAAIALAERGYSPDRLLDVLAEGVLSFDVAGLQRDAARALAHLGEPGIAKLIAIIGDPGTGSSVRETLIHELSKVSPESRQATDFLLTTATSAPDHGSRIAAIGALGSLKSRPVDVKAVLNQALATGDAEVRSAALEAWKDSGQAPGDLVARVFADPLSAVRQKGFLLLSLLPGDDPSRLAFTVEALRDKDKEVREAALESAGKLGAPGAALLAQYAAQGEPLTDGFFDGVGRLDSLGDALARVLDVRASDAHDNELDRLLSILGRAGAEAPNERKRLYALLDAADLDTRELAAQGLLTLQEDPWAHEGKLAESLMETGVNRIFQKKSRKSFHWPRDSLQVLSTVRRSIPSPVIPWPPPSGYRPPVVVPRELLGATERTTLTDIYKQLVGSLEAVSHGFEHGLFFGPPGGFAVVARMERIRPDGTPFPEPARWLKKGSPKLSLMDFLADLFFESPGYFRIIVFAVTGDLVPGSDPRAVLPAPGNGFPKMLDAFTRQPFKGKEILALVYSFERQGDAKVKPWEDGAPSALQHLEKSGVWARLGTSARP